ncbi:hypothetical protein DNL40_02280 [Xylanimonas oleitrophica]|uniref:Fibronectin type-III domain-containing protein n=1 Tax=Xylanimonas oleitrophica TaxID=2607479 RepID=A0A2W5WV97_9MICO|nr:hypothetical protein [Xylanimonas oleitrophica]PZR55217.1 hypothetical protein DNL40_02280 [Xylanimonas oleitrophica]
MTNPLAALVQALPQGPKPGADIRAVELATIVAAGQRTVQVELRGSDPIDLPALADVDWAAMIGQPCWVLRDQQSGALVMALAPRDSVPSPEVGAQPLFGTVTAVGSGSQAGRVTVDVGGGETVTAWTVASYASPAAGDVVVLGWAADGSGVAAIGRRGAAATVAPARPAAPSVSRSGGTVTVTWSKPATVDTTQVRYSTNSGATWTTRAAVTGTSTTLSISAGQTMLIQIQQSNAGGPSGWSDSARVTYPSSAPVERYETVRTIVQPSWVGTYRVSTSRWDDWNAGRYGYPNILYQGQRDGSGLLYGAAGYGTKITQLGAVEITAMRVQLMGVDLGVPYSLGWVSLTSITNPSKSGIPNGAGPTWDALGPGVNGTGWYAVGGVLGSAAVREAFRTGAYRGFALVGSSYAAVRGAGGGMALEITYRRRV